MSYSCLHHKIRSSYSVPPSSRLKPHWKPSTWKEAEAMRMQKHHWPHLSVGAHFRYRNPWYPKLHSHWHTYWICPSENNPYWYGGHNGWNPCFGWYHSPNNSFRLSYNWTSNLHLVQPNYTSGSPFYGKNFPASPYYCYNTGSSCRSKPGFHSHRNNRSNGRYHSEEFGRYGTGVPIVPPTHPSNGEAYSPSCP